MRKKMLRLGALTMLLGSSLHGQDIVGDWQGTLKTGPTERRTVLHITRETEDGA